MDVGNLFHMFKNVQINPGRICQLAQPDVYDLAKVPQIRDQAYIHFNRNNLE